MRATLAFNGLILKAKFGNDPQVTMKVKPTRNTAVVDPQHLKVKELDISLTKNYCITITIQKISVIHKFIL